MRNYLITDEESLRRAGSAVAGGSGRFVFGGMVDLWHGVDHTRQVTIGDHDNPADIVRFVFRPGGAIYSHAAAECLNMIQFYARKVELIRPHIYGYQGEGAALKSNYDECEIFRVSDGSFADCGSTPKIDVDHHSNVIAMHNHHRCQITIEGCRFYRCANGNDQHSHVIYVAGGHVEIESCSVMNCGHPFALQRRSLPEALAIVEDCRVYGVNNSCWDVSQQEWAPPASVVAFSADRNYHISECEFRGRYRRVYHLWPDLANIQCNANTINVRTDNAVLARSLSSGGVNYSADDWRSQLGHDTISEISVTAA